jgi:hypothetical protein
VQQQQQKKYLIVIVRQLFMLYPSTHLGAQKERIEGSGTSLPQLDDFWLAPCSQATIQGEKALNPTKLFQMVSQESRNSKCHS